MASPPAPSSSQRIATALGFLAAFERRDLAAMQSAVTPDMEMTTMFVTTGRREAPYRGPEGIADYFRDAEDAGLEIAIEVRGAHTTGDAVVVLGRVDGRVADRRLDTPVTYVFRIAGERISRLVVGADVEVAQGVLAAGARAAAGRGGNGGASSDVAPLVLTVDAVPENVAVVRHAVDAFAVAVGLGDAAREDVRLAVSEAASNCVLHAYEGMPEPVRRLLRVLAAQRGDLLVVDIEDEGQGMTLRPDSPGLGLGLVVMSRVASRCTIVTPPERRAGCAIHLEFPIA